MKPITDFLGIKQGIKMNILTILILNQNNVDQKQTLTGWPLGIYKLEENSKLQTNFQISPKFGLPQVPQILQYSPDLISLLNVLKNMRITQNSNCH